MVDELLKYLGGGFKFSQSLAKLRADGARAERLRRSEL